MDAESKVNLGFQRRMEASLHSVGVPNPREACAEIYSIAQAWIDEAKVFAKEPDEFIEQFDKVLAAEISAHV